MMHKYVLLMLLLFSDYLLAADFPHDHYQAAIQTLENHQKAMKRKNAKRTSL
jgi:hypothetical protein